MSLSQLLEGSSRGGRDMSTQAVEKDEGEKDGSENGQDDSSTIEDTVEEEGGHYLTPEDKDDGDEDTSTTQGACPPSKHEATLFENCQNTTMQSND